MMPIVENIVSAAGAEVTTRRICGIVEDDIVHGALKIAQNGDDHYFAETLVDGIVDASVQTSIRRKSWF